MQRNHTDFFIPSYSIFCHFLVCCHFLSTCDWWNVCNVHKFWEIFRCIVHYFNKFFLKLHSTT